MERENSSPPEAKFGLLTRQERKRLSGPGLRTFLSIADLWSLTEDERRHALGSPTRPAFEEWCNRATRHLHLILSVEILSRVSAILAIHAALNVLFASESEAMNWLRSRHGASPFNGRAPITFITGGDSEEIADARRFLDAAKVGIYMPPNSLDASSGPVQYENILIS